jgi:glycosyltransferase involved in cell wall biosynthesis
MTAFPNDWKNLNVIFSHDWLTGMRGGERVLELLCRAWPEAPVYTLIHKAGRISDDINSHPVKTSWLQHVPGIMHYYRYFLPFFPAAVERFAPPQADLAISTSHCVAKGIRTASDTHHLCYCFTPMRYAWIFYDEYFGRNPVKRMILGPMLKRLRKWDHRVSSRVTRFVAISKHVQRRIDTCYGRLADVVYPPVDMQAFTPGRQSPESFDLIVSALVPYKRIDLAVQAYAQSGRTLKIVGTGTEYEKLCAMATPNIEFLGWQSDGHILELYRSCQCLVFPGEEDFGLVPVEVQACGRPVVAYARGGALETVLEDVSGVFFDEQHPDALNEAVRECSARTWDTWSIRLHAERFSIPRFVEGFAQSIRRCMRTDPKEFYLKG